MGVIFCRHCLTTTCSCVRAQGPARLRTGRPSQRVADANKTEPLCVFVQCLQATDMAGKADCLYLLLCVSAVGWGGDVCDGAPSPDVTERADLG